MPLYEVENADKAAAEYARRSMGIATLTAKYGLVVPPPHEEIRALRLPVLVDAQVPLQDTATGKAYFVAGIHALDDTNVLLR